MERTPELTGARFDPPGSGGPSVTKIMRAAEVKEALTGVGESTFLQPPEELIAEACVKCGQVDADIAWENQTDATVLGFQPEGIGEWLRATCRRCGYWWATPALDEHEEETP